MGEVNEQRRRVPAWHRAAFALASAPLLLFTLMGWEHGAYATFGIACLICVFLAVRPARLGAAVLFWPFAAGACMFGWLLVQDVLVLARGGAPSILVDADDSVVFVLVELTMIAASALLFGVWQPFANGKSRE